jgi:hypothetical protein
MVFAGRAEERVLLVEGTVAGFVLAEVDRDPGDWLGR